MLSARSEFNLEAKQGGSVREVCVLLRDDNHSIHGVPVKFHGITGKALGSIAGVVGIKVETDGIIMVVRDNSTDDEILHSRIFAALTAALPQDAFWVKAKPRVKEKNFLAAGKDARSARHEGTEADGKPLHRLRLRSDVVSDEEQTGREQEATR